MCVCVLFQAFRFAYFLVHTSFFCNSSSCALNQCVLIAKKKSSFPFPFAFEPLLPRLLLLPNAKRMPFLQLEPAAAANEGGCSSFASLPRVFIVLLLLRAKEKKPLKREKTPKRQDTKKVNVTQLAFCFFPGSPETEARCTEDERC